MTTATDTLTVPREYARVHKSATKMLNYRSDNPIFGYHATERGAYVTDGYRLHWDCPPEDMPDTLVGLLGRTVPDAPPAQWTVTDALYRWIALIGKQRDPVLRTEPARWLWPGSGYAHFEDMSASAYRETPPVQMPADTVINAEYLTDAIAYLGKPTKSKPATIKIATTKDGAGPLVMSANGRHVLLMPATSC